MPLTHLKEANVHLKTCFLHWCFPAAVYTDMKVIPVNARNRPSFLISKIDSKQAVALPRSTQNNSTNTITSLVIRMLERVQKFPSNREIPHYHGVQNRPPMDPTLILYCCGFSLIRILQSRCFTFYGPCIVI